MQIFKTIYFLLLAYILAAIFFWELRLQKQSGSIYEQQLITLRSQLDSVSNPEQFNAELLVLDKKLSSRTKQFEGEGITFLLVILVGAVVVYSSFQRNLRLSKQQNNFMLSVTHELKSPIAAMKLNLQTLQRHHFDDDKRKQIIDRVIKESDRLNELCNNMLFASQIEGRQYKATKEQFNFSDLVEDCVEDYANHYSRQFEEEITAGCRIIGDKVMLQMAVNNLLENAVKYSPADSPIQVKLEIKNNNAQLQVIDKGKGITAEEKKKIFNKFYRVGNEQSRNTKGTGLGLYLVQKVVVEHKGKIVVKDNAPVGSVFEMCLPMVG